MKNNDFRICYNIIVKLRRNACCRRVFLPGTNVHLYIYRSDNGEIQENIIVAARFHDARKLRHDRRKRG